MHNVWLLLLTEIMFYAIGRWHTHSRQHKPDLLRSFIRCRLLPLHLCQCFTYTALDNLTLLLLGCFTCPLL
jgi:hypothetical protein